MAPRFKSSHCLLGRRKGQVDDRLDAVRLWEQREGGEEVEAVARAEESAQVAGERGGVAGDVGDAARGETGDGFNGLGFGTGAGRVEEDEVGAGRGFAF